MNTPFEFKSQNGKPLVYVREVAVKDLPDDVREQAMGAKTLYALHDEGGERLALVKSRSLAFTLARQNELSPMAAH